MLWALARLHSNGNPPMPGWTGFNISTRDRTEVKRDVVTYLPTINAPATDMKTVNEILVRSEKIRQNLGLDSIVVVSDQAIYAKTTEIV